MAKFNELIDVFKILSKNYSQKELLELEYIPYRGPSMFSEEEMQAEFSKWYYAISNYGESYLNSQGIVMIVHEFHFVTGYYGMVVFEYEDIDLYP